MIKELTQDQKDMLKPLLDSYYQEADGYMMRSYKGDADIFWKFYNAELPEVPENAFTVLVQDRTCAEMVEGALKDLLETFTGGVDAVSFAPINGQDSYKAKAATQLVNQIFLRDNDGYNVLSDAIKEALVARSAFIKRYWHTETKYVPMNTVKGIQSEEDARDMIAGWIAGGLEIDDADIELVKQEDGTFNLDCSYTGKFQNVKVEFIPVEEILIDQRARDIQSCHYFCHRTQKSKAELIDLGFTLDEINSIGYDELDFHSFGSYGYYAAKTGDITASRTNNRRFENQDIGGDRTYDQASRIWVKEHYVLTNVIEPDRPPIRYQILECAGIIKRCEAVSEIPFSVINPIPLPGNIFGESLVDKVKDIQEKRLYAQMALLDHSLKSAAPRYKAIAGSYDQRSVLNNVAGGIMEMDRPDAIMQMEVPPLSPGLTTFIGMLDNEAERRTGINSTVAGQTANAMETGRMSEASINNMIQLAQGKIRMMARNLAHGGIADLYRAIYRLVRENGEIPVDVVTAYGVQQILPSQLPDRQHIKVAVALTSEERSKKANQLIAFAQFKQMVDPGNMFAQPNHIHFMEQEFLSCFGIDNTFDYMVPLEKFQPPQPSQAEILAMQKTQAEIQKLQSESGKLVNDAHVEVEKLAFEQQKAADDSKREDSKLIFEQQKGADETNIAHGTLALEDKKEEYGMIKHKDKHAVEIAKVAHADKTLDVNTLMEGEKLKKQLKAPVITNGANAS